MACFTASQFTADIIKSQHEGTNPSFPAARNKRTSTHSQHNALTCGGRAHWTLRRANQPKATSALSEYHSSDTLSFPCNDSLVGKQDRDKKNVLWRSRKNLPRTTFYQPVLSFPMMGMTCTSTSLPARGTSTWMKFISHTWCKFQSAKVCRAIKHSWPQLRRARGKTGATREGATIHNTAVFIPSQLLACQQLLQRAYVSYLEQGA